MIKNNNQKKEPLAVQTMDFLRKYFVFILLILIGYPFLKRFLDKQGIENNKSSAEVVKAQKQLENKNPITQSQKASKITQSAELHAAAAKLAHDFGFDSADQGNWWDFANPRGMTENDEEIRNTLMKYRNYFPILEKLYFEVYTNSRKLRTDILQLLDADMLKQVRTAIKI